MYKLLSWYVRACDRVVQLHELYRGYDFFLDGRDSLFELPRRLVSGQRGLSKLPALWRGDLWAVFRHELVHQLSARHLLCRRIDFMH